MFKLRPIAVTLATVFYAVAISAATSAIPQNKTAGFQQISATKLNQKNNQTQSIKPKVSQFKTSPGGLNHHLVPASIGDKFIVEPNRSGEDIYIVRLRDLPVSTYDGRLKIYSATSKSVVRAELEKQSSINKTKVNGINETKTNKIEVDASRIIAYKNYLQNKQNEVMVAAKAQGISNSPRIQFTDAVNGFSIKMTQAQAQKMAELPQVATIQRSKMQQLHTDRGPAFIGADQVWAGNSVTNLPQKGEGIIVGIIDTGINTDHASFADIGDDDYDHNNPRGEGHYLGDCATGVLTCNDKLIGVWSWPVITDSYNGAAPASGEDYQGHGSHTAGTAAGNYIENIPLTSPSIGDGDGVPMGFTFDSASGVAPHANIIAYQVCQLNGCPDEAILKAYEQAINDGVDVINFSIGGGERFPWEDATELAMLSAREAGISVAVSAGNAGGDQYNTIFGSLSHSSPWSMIVAASTTDRVMEITNNLLTTSGGINAPWLYIDPTSSWGDDIAGFSTSSIIDGNPVKAADFADELCLNEFAPGTFTSEQIVICKRGQNARVAKANNVLAGGAGGFILYNAEYYDGMTQAEFEVFDDVFPLPGIHMTNDAGNNILNWIADGETDHKISISGGSVERTIDPAAGDVLAHFSSLGPSLTYSHHLAPNIAGPGVNILAPYADQHPLHPGAAFSQDWNIISGTSMASPHLAGSMALVREAHPNWSAAEVQSALEMTASQTVKRDVNPDWQPDGHPATQHRAGSGRVDVLAAINSGLVMDETAANFVLANPRKGGDVRQLNLPQLMNSNCRGGICSWIRTVKATRAGNWTISGESWVYDRWNTGEGEISINNASMQFFPASFSLNAGESQTIVIKANIGDIQYQHNSIVHGDDVSQIELWTNVNLTADNSAIPAVHWPVSINFDRRDLPNALNIAVHRDNGSYHLADLPLPASNDWHYRGFGPVKADITQVTLPQDNNHNPIYSDGDYAPGNNQLTIVDVPENTARLVVEVLAHIKGYGRHEMLGNLDGSMAIHIGRDINTNGVADFDDEWLCSSTTQIELNYCSFTNPDAGQYWVLLSNTSLNMFDYDLETGIDPFWGVTADELKDTYKIATAIVPAEVNGLTVSGPSSSDGNLVGIDLNWELTDMLDGDVAYAGVDFGSSNSPGSVGFIPLKLTRGLDDVSVTNNQSVRGGDIIDVKVHVVENNTGSDREFNLSTQIPNGLSLVAGSVKVNSISQQSNLTVDGRLIRVTGTQVDSTNWTRTYNVTTNENDVMCRTPNYGKNPKGGFVGLSDNYGFVLDLGGTALDWAGTWNEDYTEYNNQFELALSNYWGEEGRINLFHNEDYSSYANLIISPQGFVSFDHAWYDTQHIFHSQFPYYMSPYAPFIGVMWKGESTAVGWDFAADALGTPLNIDWYEPSNNSGMTLGYAYDPTNNIDDIVIEWKNSRTQHIENSWSAGLSIEDKADRYNMNLILSKGYRYGSGEFELIMAYGDIDYASETASGSIGLHGSYGPLDVGGFPYGQETGINYAYNDLASKIKKDRVVCYDYSGPESTQFDLSFQVRVAETAAGQILDLDFVSEISGMPTKLVANPIKVASNINLAGFNDITVNENTTFDVLVAYADAENNANSISVSGEHVSAIINSHTSGSVITIVPEANWYGQTEVKITVADISVTSDAASQKFNLTVVSDNIDFGCTDSTATNFDINANTDDGSCIAAIVEKSSGGGSMGLVIILLSLLSLGRRKIK